MIGLKRDVIYDLDASLSGKYDGGSRTSATITHGWNHIANYNQNACPPPTNVAAWDSAIMCDQTVTIKRVIFTNLAKAQLFKAQELKAAEIANVDEVVDAASPDTAYTRILSWLPDMEPKKEKPFSYGLPYITGRIYNIWWGSGIDFSHLSIFSTPRWTPSDKGIVFKFNYSENREFYNIGPMVAGNLLTAADYIVENSNSAPNPNTCTNGEYFHTNT